MKYFYVYYSYEEWGRGYIGKRECSCLPEEDTNYFGSFRDRSFRPTQKVILGVFNSCEEALEAEVSLHTFYKVDDNPHFANKARQTSKKFYKCQEGENNGNYGNRWHWTEEQKRARSILYTGRKTGPRSEETKKKISLTRKERGCGLGNSYAKGNSFSLTEEQKENRRRAALARPEVECPVCGRTCKGNAALTNHLKKHDLDF